MIIWNFKNLPFLFYSNVNENVSEISKTSGSYEKVQEEKQSGEVIFYCKLLNK